jgi:site-specific recombinase XerD
VKTRPLGVYRVRRLLRTWGELAGVSVTPHQLRHTLATRLVNRGMRIELIRRLLGHRYLNSTQIYARVYDRTVQDHFESATANLEAIPVDDWPHPIASPVQFTEECQVQ